MAVLKEVHLSVKYGESIQTQVALKNYQAELTYVLQPEDQDEEDEWRKSDKLDQIRRWMSQQLKKSIHCEARDDGARSGKERDYQGHEDEPADEGGED